MLIYYGGNYVKALQHIYPDIGLDSSRFHYLPRMHTYPSFFILFFFIEDNMKRSKKTHHLCSSPLGGYQKSKEVLHLFCEPTRI